MFSENYTPRTALGSAERAHDPSLTDGELAMLARSEESKVRAVVAARPQTPLTTLIKLADDVSPAVRAGVAANPRLDIPLEMREELAADKSPEVLYAVVRCEATPVSVVQKVARNRNRDVALAAKSRLKAIKAGKSVSRGAVGEVGLASS